MEERSREVASMAVKTKTCSSVVTRMVGRCVSRLTVVLVLAMAILVAVSVGYAAAVGVSSSVTSGAGDEGILPPGTLPPGHPDVTLPPGHPDVQVLPPGHPPIDAIPGQPKQDPTTGGPVYEL